MDTKKKSRPSSHHKTTSMGEPTSTQNRTQLKNITDSVSTKEKTGRDISNMIKKHGGGMYFKKLLGSIYEVEIPTITNVTINASGMSKNQLDYIKHFNVSGKIGDNIILNKEEGMCEFATLDSNYLYGVASGSHLDHDVFTSLFSQEPINRKNIQQDKSIITTTTSQSFHHTNVNDDPKPMPGEVNLVGQRKMTDLPKTETEDLNDIDKSPVEINNAQTTILTGTLKTNQQDEQSSVNKTNQQDEQSSVNKKKKEEEQPSVNKKKKEEESIPIGNLSSNESNEIPTPDAAPMSVDDEEEEFQMVECDTTEVVMDEAITKKIPSNGNLSKTPIETSTTEKENVIEGNITAPLSSESTIADEDINTPKISEDSNNDNILSFSVKLPMNKKQEDVNDIKAINVFDYSSDTEENIRQQQEYDEIQSVNMKNDETGKKKRKKEGDEIKSPRKKKKHSNDTTVVVNDKVVDLSIETCEKDWICFLLSTINHIENILMHREKEQHLFLYKKLCNLFRKKEIINDLEYECLIGSDNNDDDSKKEEKKKKKKRKYFEKVSSLYRGRIESVSSKSFELLDGIDGCGTYNRTMEMFQKYYLDKCLSSDKSLIIGFDNIFYDMTSFELFEGFYRHKVLKGKTIKYNGNKENLSKEKINGIVSNLDRVLSTFYIYKVMRDSIQVDDDDINIVSIKTEMLEEMEEYLGVSNKYWIKDYCDKK